MVRASLTLFLTGPAFPLVLSDLVIVTHSLLLILHADACQAFSCAQYSCEALLAVPFFERGPQVIACQSPVTSCSCLSNSLSVVLRGDWAGRWWLFDGAAVSAFFVVIIVALTVLLALRYMLLTRRSLCHPRSSFGRGLMVATGLFAALHFINIGTHVSLS